MVLFTDIGKDIDDAVALVYAIVSKIPLKFIVTTSKDSVESAKICQNIVNSLSDRYPLAKNIRIIAGSTCPIKNNEIFHSNIYRGDFSKGYFPVKDLDAFDYSSIDKSDAIVIGPLTDLVKFMENKKIKRVMYMGQAIKDHSILAPDMEAYNLRSDKFASEACFQFQETIPFGFVGKNLAYKVPFTKTDFEEIGRIDNPVAKFLKDHAFTSFEFFKNNVPDLYERIYKNTDNLSYCYDPLTMLAATHPNMFIFEKFGKHRIGVDIQADKAKAILMDRIKKGLS